jgi:hypothetical protein
MKWAIQILSLCALATACGPSPSGDIGLAQKVVGSWKWTDQDQTLVTVVILRPDRTFVTNVTNGLAFGPREVSYQGTWRIQGGVLMTELAKTSEPDRMPVGTMEMYQIIRAEERKSGSWRCSLSHRSPRTFYIGRTDVEQGSFTGRRDSAHVSIRTSLARRQ